MLTACCCLRQVLLMTEDVDKVAAYATAAQRKNATTAAASLPLGSVPADRCGSCGSTDRGSAYTAGRG